MKKYRTPGAELNLVLIVGIICSGISILNHNLSLLVILCLFLLPLSFRDIYKNSFLKKLLIFAILWTTIQLISNFVNGSKLLTIPAFVGICSWLIGATFYWINSLYLNSYLRILLASILCWLMFAIFLPTTQYQAIQNPWKYKYGVPISLLLLGITYFQKKIVYTLAMSAFLAIYSNHHDFRSLTIFLLMTLIIINSKKGKGGSRGIFAIWFLLTLLVLGLTYPTIAESGILGDRARLQQESLNAKNEKYNFILSARVELPQTLYLAFLHPLLGIGSYGTLDYSDSLSSIEFISKHISHLDENQKFQLLRSNSSSQGYDAHSQLGSSLLYGGILVIPFWLYFLANIGKLLKRSLDGSVGFSAVHVLLLLSVLSDIFFSPISFTTHLSIGIAIFIIATLSDD